MALEKVTKGKPPDVQRFLMEQHNLLQKYLADVFERRALFRSLNGKRE
jgi:hypothetical protein